MEEIRGVWIANRPHSQVLSSRGNIQQAMDLLVQIGFNVVFPVVWNQGLTLFRSQVMLNNGFDEIDKFFAQQERDPLEELIYEAHERKIAVIPWFEYGFACSARADGGHILQKNSHWAARTENSNLPLIKGGLTWMNGLDCEVQNFIQSLVVEVAQKYEIDGIQGDDRLPALPSDGGYNDDTISRFKQQFGVNPPPAPPSDKKSIQDENSLWNQWVQWRADILTEFLVRLHQVVKEVGQQKQKNLVMAIAPNPYPFCLFHYLQDTKAWVDKEIVDIISPQLYREEFSRYQTEINLVKQHFPNDLQKFVPGIAFRANNVDITSMQLLDYIQLNRDSGLQGHVLFHYEALQDGNNGSSVIAKALAQGSHSQVASLPSLFSIA